MHGRVKYKYFALFSLYAETPLELLVLVIQALLFNKAV